MQLIQWLLLMEIEYEEHRHSRKLRRQLRDIHNPFEMSNADFQANFQLNKEAAKYVIDTLCREMREGPRTTKIPNYLRVLIVLKFFTAGTFQRGVKNSILAVMSQSMVNRSLREVSDVLVRTCVKQWIKFPKNDCQRTTLINCFRTTFRLPQILGVVDCTHVAIIKPHKDDQSYLNHRKYHSINVQIVSDAKMCIRSLVAQYPGSYNDTHIWNFSTVGKTMRANYENGDMRSKILGDCSYPCLPWLFVPLENPTNEQEERFNASIKSCQKIVKNCIGLLKARFQCLKKQRTLYYTPNNAKKIIISCCILHNIALHYNVQNPEPVWDDIDMDVSEVQDYTEADIIWMQKAQQTRQQYIQRYF